MKATHDLVGPPPPLKPIPATAYRPYQVTLSFSAEERKNVFRALACTDTDRCRQFTGDRERDVSEALYSLNAALFYAMRDAGETTE